jgi:hypothetical protein
VTEWLRERSVGVGTNLAFGKRALPGLGLSALICLGVAQCGGSESQPPAARVVAQAARATFKPSPAGIDMKVKGPAAHLQVRGPVELATGRFRVRVWGDAPSFLKRGRSRVVLGTSGEGFETTYFVIHESLGHRPRPERCWYNPHAPVGSNRGTISVEESVRIVGSVLESLRGEIETARESADEEYPGAYDVTLRPTATHPRDDFNDTKRRIWGDRTLLARLDGPIEVLVSEARRISGLALRLSGYRPTIGWVSSKRAPRPVSIQAAISPTDRQLHLRDPGCLAME